MLCCSMARIRSCAENCVDCAAPPTVQDSGVVPTASASPCELSLSLGEGCDEIRADTLSDPTLCASFLLVVQSPTCLLSSGVSYKRYRYHSRSKRKKRSKDPRTPIFIKKRAPGDRYFFQLPTVRRRFFHDPFSDINKIFDSRQTSPHERHFTPSPLAVDKASHVIVPE